MAHGEESLRHLVETHIRQSANAHLLGIGERVTVDAHHQTFTHAKQHHHANQHDQHDANQDYPVKFLHSLCLGD